MRQASRHCCPLDNVLHQSIARQYEALQYGEAITIQILIVVPTVVSDTMGLSTFVSNLHLEKIVVLQLLASLFCMTATLRMNRLGGIYPT